jgi:hypothetical protein
MTRGSKGFSGLDSLVSDVDQELAKISDRISAQPAREGTQRAQKPAGNNEGRDNLMDGLRAEPARPPSAKPMGGVGKVFLGFVAFMVFMVWITDQDSTPTEPGKIVPSTSTSGDTSESKLPEMIRPPVGTERIHSIAEIRWCRAEDIRIEARRLWITSPAESDRFNASVVDYNSRCGSFKYRPGTLERAHREVDRHRAEIVAGIRSTVGALESAVTPQTPMQRAQVIMEIQRALMLLGYDRNAVDGIYGPKTKAAIESFQRDKGLVADGQVSQELLDGLRNELLR